MILPADNHYSVHLSIDAASGRLEVDADLLISSGKGARVVEPILHRNFAIDRLVCDQMAGWVFAREQTSFPFAPEAGALRIHLHEPDAEGPVRIHVSYHGVPGVVEPWQVNRVSPDWVELGMYMPWFPFVPGIRFTYSVAVSAAPNLQVIGACPSVRQNAFWNFDMHEAVDDIPLLAAPRFLAHTCHAGADSVTAFCTREQDFDAAREMADFTGGALDFYRSLFDDSAPRPQLSIVVAPRQKGGGYARRGLIVVQMEQYQPDDPYNFKYAAHEAAHLWWTGAPVDTWEDWLNESFAEYSAMLALKAKYGNEAFDGIIAAKRKRSEGVRPIRAIGRNDEDAYVALYSKGPLLLHDLCGRIGEERFIEVLRRRLYGGVFTTAGFLRELAAVAGEESAAAFDGLLDR